MNPNEEHQSIMDELNNEEAADIIEANQAMDEQFYGQEQSLEEITVAVAFRNQS
ncbi:hypothetical protein [Paenibacillus sp. YYML68]|uniref:hypothetical protein n=1 Tax=Paenibacillus sp. YYML68 TaxID=2909250 RepID=UPI002493A946|nr:hypothetical protein [Paenibacillus sp. YYML68]